MQEATQAPRENLIQNAIEFLQDPRVVSSSDDRKKSFLKSKGMTDAEIDEAMRRVSANPGPSAPPVPMMPQGQMVPVGAYQPPPMHHRGWKTLAFLFVACSGIGQVIYYLIKKYVAPFVRKLLTGSDPKQTKTPTNSKIQAKITELQEGLSVIQQFMEKQNEKQKFDQLLKEKEEEMDKIRFEVLQQEIQSLRPLANPTCLTSNSNIPSLNSPSPFVPPPVQVDPEQEKKAKETTVPWRTPSVTLLGRSLAQPAWMSQQQNLSWLHEKTEKTETEKTEIKPSLEKSQNSPEKTQNTIETPTSTNPTSEVSITNQVEKIVETALAGAETKDQTENK